MQVWPSNTVSAWSSFAERRGTPPILSKETRLVTSRQPYELGSGYDRDTEVRRCDMTQRNPCPAEPCVSTNPQNGCSGRGERRRATLAGGDVVRLAFPDLRPDPGSIDDVHPTRECVADMVILTSVGPHDGLDRALPGRRRGPGCTTSLAQQACDTRCGCSTNATSLRSGQCARRVRVHWGPAQEADAQGDQPERERQRTDFQERNDGWDHHRQAPH
jgi:hypothetical protein